MMSFCGQCGFQLASNDTRCPRCGTAIEPEGTITPALSSGYFPDDATVESSRYIADKQGQYDTHQAPPAFNQQKLVLGPGTYPPVAQGINEPTSMIQSSPYGGGPPTPGTSYPGYASQSFPQQTGYPAYTGSETGYSGQYPPAQRKGPRTTGLVFIFLGIMLILGALVLFALQRNGIIGGTGPAQSSTTTSSVVASTPLEQAEAVVQHYYSSVNAHDYMTAYHLWKNNTEKFTDFKNGYRNTQHTMAAFGTGHMQSPTMAYLPVTITATEINSATQAIRRGVYTGYYLVQKQPDGTWLIFSGNLNAA